MEKFYKPIIYNASESLGGNQKKERVCYVPEVPELHLQQPQNSAEGQYDNEPHLHQAPWSAPQSNASPQQNDADVPDASTTQHLPSAHRQPKATTKPDGNSTRLRSACNLCNLSTITCHAIHDHFVTLDLENRLKTTITLSHKPITPKTLYKPVVVFQSLWTIQTNSKRSTSFGRRLRA